MFAPSEETVNAARQWLIDFGISSDRITHSDNQGWLAFDTTTEDAERLLHAEYHLYEHSSSGSMTAGCDTYVHFDHGYGTPDSDMFLATMFQNTSKNISITSLRVSNFFRLQREDIESEIRALAPRHACTVIVHLRPLKQTPTVFPSRSQQQATYQTVTLQLHRTAFVHYMAFRRTQNIPTVRHGLITRWVFSRMAIIMPSMIWTSSLQTFPLIFLKGPTQLLLSSTEPPLQYPISTLLGERVIWTCNWCTRSVSNFLRSSLPT